MKTNQLVAGVASLSFTKTKKRELLTVSIADLKQQMSSPMAIINVLFGMGIFTLSLIGLC
jgi:hypothetical protein